MRVQVFYTRIFRLSKEENVIACISGFANSNDAFHPSSLSDEGFCPMAAMRGALEYAGLLPYEIDSVIAHGTGTPNNDKVEGLSIKKYLESHCHRSVL